MKYQNSSYDLALHKVIGSGSSISLTPPAPWVRPSEWPTIDTLIGPTDQKMVAVYMVPDAAEDLVPASVSVTTSAGTYTVDWGDGTIDSSVASGVTASHFYDNTNVNLTSTSYGYKCAVIQVYPNTGNLTALNITVSATGEYSTAFRSHGWIDIDMRAPNIASLASFAQNMYQIKQFRVRSAPLVTSLASMFTSCSGLENFIADTGAFTGIANVSSMFSSCYALTSVSLFDTSSCTSFNSMFYSDYAIASVPLFDTGSGANFNSMFYSCTSLLSVPFFNLSSATSASNMFQSCSRLSSVPLFETSSCTTLSAMFSNCVSLASVPLLDTSSCANFSSMFIGCQSLQSVPLFNTSAGTTFASMFASCRSLIEVPLFDTSHGTSFLSMFNGCYALPSVPFLDTSSGTNFASMFFGCTSLRSIPLLNTALSTTFNGMFTSCLSLTTIPLINTGSGTDFTNMFQTCMALTNLPTLNFSSATITTGMFTTCKSLTSVPNFTKTTYTPTALVDTNFQATAALSAISWRFWNTGNIDISNCYLLGANALNEIFTNLPSSSNTITITNCIGKTACTRTIATNKGWTVTG